MSDDWVKIRASLLEHPNVVRMSRFLTTFADFHQWIGGDTITNRHEPSRYVTVAALLRVWSTARRHGLMDGNDLVLGGTIVDDLTIIAGVPHFGEAMSHVGWAIISDDGSTVTLPRFKTWNVPYTDAERQKRRRERDQRNKENKVTESVTDSHVLSRNASVSDSLSVSISPKKKRTKKNDLPDEVLIPLYDDYPGLRRGRAVGIQAARKAVNSGMITLDALHEAIKTYAASNTVRKTIDDRKPEMIPHMATWINQQRWQDSDDVKIAKRKPSVWDMDYVEPDGP